MMVAGCVTSPRPRFTPDTAIDPAQGIVVIASVRDTSGEAVPFDATISFRRVTVVDGRLEYTTDRSDTILYDRAECSKPSSSDYTWVQGPRAACYWFHQLTPGYYVLERHTVAYVRAGGVRSSVSGHGGLVDLLARPPRRNLNNEVGMFEVKAGVVHVLPSLSVAIPPLSVAPRGEIARFTPNNDAEVRMAFGRRFNLMGPQSVYTSIVRADQLLSTLSGTVPTQ